MLYFAAQKKRRTEADNSTDKTVQFTQTLQIISRQELGATKPFIVTRKTAMHHVEPTYTSRICTHLVFLSSYIARSFERTGKHE